MAIEPKQTIEALHQLGLTPLDWVDAERFSELTGIATQKLNDRKKKWPENVVWTKQDGNLYYSIKGYNSWMTEQANARYQKASELGQANCKSTSRAMAKRITSPSRTQSAQKVLRQPLRLDAT